MTDQTEEIAKVLYAHFYAGMDICRKAAVEVMKVVKAPKPSRKARRTCPPGK